MDHHSLTRSRLVRSPQLARRSLTPVPNTVNRQSPDETSLAFATERGRRRAHIAGAAIAVPDTLRSILKYGMTLAIAAAAVVSHAAIADDTAFCDAWARKTAAQYDENYRLQCLPLSDIGASLSINFSRCMSLGQGLANQFTKMVEDRFAECRARAIKEKGELTPAPMIGDILKETKPAQPPAQPPVGGSGAEYATAINPATIYVEPGGPAFKDANGDDIGIPVGSKWLVLKKKTDPVWYKLQTQPVGWVWGEDVTLGP